VGLTYELFLDEEGKKISKSVGKGLTVDTWVEYAPIESLLYYIYQNPQRARRLFWDVVPKCVDDYLDALRRFPDVAEEKRPEQDVWHIGQRGASVPGYGAQVNFSMVNNLISALGADSADLLVDYLERYDEKATDYQEVTQSLVEKGLNYYRDFVLPNKEFREPSDAERALLVQVAEKLQGVDAQDENALQSIPFDIARSVDMEPRALFSLFYEVVLGQERGPRFGSFARMVGVEKVRDMINARLA